MAIVMIILSLQMQVLAEGPELGAPMYYNSDGEQIGYPSAGETVDVKINALGRTDNAKMYVAFYKEGKLIALNSSDYTDNEDIVGSLSVKNVKVPDDMTGTVMRTFVWNKANSAVIPCKIPNAITLRGQSSDNRVVLTWDTKDGFTKGNFDVFRDGEKIAEAKADKGGYIIETQDYSAHTYYVKDQYGRISNEISAQAKKAVINNDALAKYGAWISKDGSSYMNEVGTGSFEYVEKEGLLDANRNPFNFKGYMGGNNFSSGTAVPNGAKGYESPDNESRVWVMNSCLHENPGSNAGTYGFIGNDGFGVTIDEGRYTASQSNFTIYIEYWGKKTAPFKLRYAYQENGTLNTNQGGKVIDFPVDSTAQSTWKVAKINLTDAYFAKLPQGIFHGSNQFALGSGVPNWRLDPCYIRRVAVLPTEYVNTLPNPNNIFEERIAEYADADAKYPNGLYISYENETTSAETTGITLPYVSGKDIRTELNDASHHMVDNYLQVSPVPKEVDNIGPSLKPRFRLDDDYITERDTFVEFEIRYKSHGITTANLYYANSSGNKLAYKTFEITDDDTIHTAVVTLNDAGMKNNLFNEGAKNDFAIFAGDGAQWRDEADGNYLYVYSIAVKNASHRRMQESTLSIPSLYLMGDSICQTYGGVGYMDGITGWGEMVGSYIDSNVRVVNKAVAGSSTKTFPNYSNVYSSLKPGDYVTVQFGHNDSTTDSRFVALDQYKLNLQNIIDNVTSRGATPIFLSSTACYDRNSGNLSSTDAITPYRAAMKDVAESNGIMFVDVFSKCIELFNDYDWKYAPYDFINDDGGVHLTRDGANEVAKAVLRGIMQTPGADTLKMFIKSDDIAAGYPKLPNPESGKYIVYSDAIYSDAVVLRWGTDFEPAPSVNYSIYRRETAGTQASVKVGDTSVSGFVDRTGLQANTQYEYTVYNNDKLLGSVKITTTGSSAPTSIALNAQAANYIIPSQTQLFIAGDSTSEKLDVTKYFPASTWGMAIDDGYFDGRYNVPSGDSSWIGPSNSYSKSCGEYFRASVKTQNIAIGGYTVKKFIGYSKLAYILKISKPGDYIFIQFGHNELPYANATDANVSGNVGARVGGLENGYVDDSYEYWLKYLVERAREKGLRPVILNPILERGFDAEGNVMREVWSERQLESYRVAAEEVAEDLNVPFIDIASRNEELLRTWGVEKSKYLYLYLTGDIAQQYSNNFNSLSRPLEDYTHLSYIGADEIAKLIVQEIKKSDDNSQLAPLKKMINPLANLSLRNPNSINGY